MWREFETCLNRDCGRIMSYYPTKEDGQSFHCVSIISNPIPLHHGCVLEGQVGGLSLIGNDTYLHNGVQYKPLAGCVTGYIEALKKNSEIGQVNPGTNWYPVGSWQTGYSGYREVPCGKYGYTAEFPWDKCLPNNKWFICIMQACIKHQNVTLQIKFHGRFMLYASERTGSTFCALVRSQLKRCSRMRQDL